MDLLANPRRRTLGLDTSQSCAYALSPAMAWALRQARELNNSNDDLEDAAVGRPQRREPPGAARSYRCASWLSMI